MEGYSFIWVEFEHSGEQMFGLFIAVLHDLSVGTFDHLGVREGEFGLDIEDLSFGGGI